MASRVSQVLSNIKKMDCWDKEYCLKGLWLLAVLYVYHGTSIHLHCYYREVSGLDKHSRMVSECDITFEQYSRMVMHVWAKNNDHVCTMSQATL